MTKTIAAAVLSDSVWGGPDLPPPPTPRQPVDWQELKKILRLMPNNDFPVTVDADGNLRFRFR
ncbi:hypothetical protein [Kitasatospora sp. NPDC093102]|uniref:hypothetical protein n=1 Tax=Kitasatospora sp. NPDC093102 TaxID=3155069 RepID=UPI003414FC50